MLSTWIFKGVLKNDGDYKRKQKIFSGNLLTNIPFWYIYIYIWWIVVQFRKEDVIMYQKAVFEVLLFGMEDVITTSTPEPLYPLVPDPEWRTQASVKKQVCDTIVKHPILHGVFYFLINSFNLPFISAYVIIRSGFRIRKGAKR